MNSLCVSMAVDFIFLEYEYDENKFDYLFWYQIIYRYFLAFLES